jgi:hypothetical protein
VHRRLSCVVALTAVLVASCRTGASRIRPEEIHLSRRNVAPEIVAATQEDPIERGTPRPVIDGIGWVFGIPERIVLWDWRVENHHVSDDTERAVADYLDDNDLDHVKVRLNQYRPLDDWRRLTKNRTVGWPYRYTLGALSVAGETIFPGRLFGGVLGGDHYNPYTATVHVYSDVPALAIQQAAKAKDFTRRKYPGTYSLSRTVPILDLWPETIATGDSLAYTQRLGPPDLEKEAYRILYPSYGATMAGAFDGFLPGPVVLPVYAGTVVAGHVAGRARAKSAPQSVNAPAWSSDSGSDEPVIRTASSTADEEADDEARIAAGLP